MPHALSETGTTLDDKYILLGEIESNELYSLYRAENLRQGQRVTIQLCRSADHSDEVLDAAQRVARIQHDNVWPVLDFGTAPSGVAYVALAAIEGQTLDETVKRLGLLDETEARELTRQLLLGLAACHERGVVHARLSPHTVWLTVSADRASVKLYGFGLKGFAPSARHWLAPEAARPGSDARADLYSAAGILLTLLGGEPGSEKLTVPSGLEPRLATLVLHGLSREPDERPGSAREFLTALEKLDASETAASVPQAPPVSATMKVSRRRLRRPVAAAVLSDSLLLAPKIPRAAPAPLFDANDARFSTTDLGQRRGGGFPAPYVRRRTLEAALIGVMIGLLVAWLAGFL